MKIHDISQELFHCKVFPGDESPQFKKTISMAEGGVCNLTVFSQCAHNGTHVDAPYHFIDQGRTIDQIDLNRVIGEAKVVEFTGDVKAEDIRKIMKSPCKRLLLKGNCAVTLEAAIEMNRHGILLMGNESQTVGPENDPIPVHLELLKNEVILLEGVSLKDVPEGNYFLNAAPINLGGAEGAPCRAILIDFEHEKYY